MLHGNIGPAEFYVFVGGANVSNTYFYEEDGPNTRFFSRGNELTLYPDRIHYKGTGGSFCEYMFGVEKPFKDLTKKEISNRLAMFGAYLDKGERLVFTNNISGSESFQRLFLLGNAVKNYYFLISSDYKMESRKRQRHIVRAIGKFLKRTALVANDKDAELLNVLVKELGEPRATVFIFKFVHRENMEFYEAFRDFYSKSRILTPEEEMVLNGIAERYQIDHYQQERIKIDCMYKHPDNRSIVDEYRDVLLGIASKETAQSPELARLHRLKTLSIRNNIPGILFDTLDELLPKGKTFQALEEPEYLKESRAILENLFFKTPALKTHIIKEDIAKLIMAKHTAHLNSDMGFERILLDIGRACDEFARENNDFSVFEELSSIITYFDRYDNVNSSLSRIAFMEHLELSEDSIRSLVGNKKEFDTLDKDLFKDIFIGGLLANKYITAFGKKKIRSLFDGVEKVLKGDASVRDVLSSLYKIGEEESVYKYIRTTLKAGLRGSYTSADMKKEITGLRNEIRTALIKHGISADVIGKIFDKVLIDLKKESYYVNNLLPVITENRDMALREDFFNNSGLDRFYLENLEKEYLEDNGFHPFVEGSLSGERELSGTGGGERI